MFPDLEASGAWAGLELLQRVVVCVGSCWVGSRDLEEQEELCPPGTWDCCSGRRDWGGTGLSCGEVEKLCGSLLFSWLSLGELLHTVLNVLFQAENKTKPKIRFGTRQLQVSGGNDLAGMGGFSDGMSISWKGTSFLQGKSSCCVENPTVCSGFWQR